MCYAIRWFKCKLKPPNNNATILTEGQLSANNNATILTEDASKVKQRSTPKIGKPIVASAKSLINSIKARKMSKAGSDSKAKSKTAEIITDSEPQT